MLTTQSSHLFFLLLLSLTSLFCSNTMMGCHSSLTTSLFQLQGRSLYCDTSPNDHVADGGGACTVIPVRRYPPVPLIVTNG